MEVTDYAPFRSFDADASIRRSGLPGDTSTLKGWRRASSAHWRLKPGFEAYIIAAAPDTVMSRSSAVTDRGLPSTPVTRALEGRCGAAA
jgi:hypothetical protein